MSEAKFHHYVPRFYLSRFCDQTNKIWIFDKIANKVFTTAPENIGGVNHFYRIGEFEEQGLDPLIMEKQFSALEAEASNITQDWFKQILNSSNVIIPEVNRDIMSLYITTQLLRTVEAREQIVQFSDVNVENYNSREDASGLHIALLWDDTTISLIKQQISNCIWLFGKNESSTPFNTSDHPVLIKTYDHKQWILGARVFDEGMYIVFPISPTNILYCYEPNHWERLKKFNNTVTPIEFTEDMVNHENSGQVGMSNRFIFSCENNFGFAYDFLFENGGGRDPNRFRF